MSYSILTSLRGARKQLAVSVETLLERTEKLSGDFRELRIEGGVARFGF
jgi:hypothetical protein